MATYAEKLRDPRWQSKRLEVLNRDNFTCQMCNDKTTELHIHHFCYPASGNPWESDLDDLITYCKHCHSAVEKLNVHIEFIQKMVIDKCKTLLICFPFENHISFALYDEKKRQIFDSAEVYYNYGKNIILPIHTPQEWICDACGTENFNKTKCRMCGWLVKDKELQHG